MPRVGLLMLALLVAGCGAQATRLVATPAGDPARGLLPMNSVAMAFVEEGRKDHNPYAIATKADQPDSPIGAYIVAVGTHVTVVDDPGPESDPERWVKVHFKDGEHQGKAASVHRRDLRPVR